MERRLLLSDGAIHGNKWNDLDGDGVRDGGEPGLPNWSIFIDSNDNSQFDVGEPAQLTDALGNYLFTGLAAGTYRVGEQVAAGWVQSFPGNGGANAFTHPAVAGIGAGGVVIHQSIIEAAAEAPASTPVRFEGDAPSDFVVSGYKWPQPGGPGTLVTITYSYSNLLNGTLPGGLSAAQLRAATEEAMALWASFAPLSFIEVADSGPPASDASYPTAAAPDIRIGHHLITDPPNALAHAHYPFSVDEGLAGDVHFDSADTWALGQTPDAFDVLEVMVHELGHSLGLFHEDPFGQGNDAIMNPFYGGRFAGLGTGFLLDDDIAGIRAIYGTSGAWPGMWLVEVDAGEVVNQIDFGNFADPPPTVDIVDVTPDPRSTGVQTIDIVFSESVNGLDISDFTLTRDGVPVDLGSATLASDSGAYYTLWDLQSLTAIAGTYTLTLNAAGSEITDSAGNPLSSGASDSWVMDAVNTGSISGKVFQDNNDNGFFDSGEPVMGGMVLWLDNNDNGISDGEPLTVTNGSGNYSFPGLPAGNYNVRQDALPNYLPTTAEVLRPTVPGGSDFTVIGGAWGGVGGTYQITTASGAITDHLNNRAIHNLAISGDFNLELDATALTAPNSNFNDFAVIFGYQDARNYYFFSSNQSDDGLTSGIMRVQDDIISELVNIPQLITPGTSYHLRLEYTDNEIRAYRNGMLRASVAAPAPITGRVGIGAKGNKAIFDNFVLTAAPASTLINEDFSDSAVTGQNHGNFPLLFTGGGGQDSFQLSATDGGESHHINHSVNGGPVTQHTIAKATLGSNALTFLGNGLGDTLTIDYVGGEPVPVAGLSVGSLALDLLGTSAGETITVLAGSYFSESSNVISLQGNVSDVTVDAGGGDDLIGVGYGTPESGIAIDINGGIGDDELWIDSFEFAFATATTIASTGENLVVSYAAFETLSMNPNGAEISEDLNGLNLNMGREEAFVPSDQHLNRFYVNGSVNVGPFFGLGDDVVITCTELILGPSGHLTVHGDSALIVDYDGVSPIGSWNGSAYTGITGVIQSGDIWGDGAEGSIGIAEASEALGLSGAQTKVWHGEIVNASSVLIGSVPGDADLSGALDADDYFRIDSNYNKYYHGDKILNVGVSYSKGDFNYDGIIDGDDFAIIDAAYSAQFASPIAAAGLAGIAGGAELPAAAVFAKEDESAWGQMGETE